MHCRSGTEIEYLKMSLLRLAFSYQGIRRPAPRARRTRGFSPQRDLSGRPAYAMTIILVIANQEAWTILYYMSAEE